MAEATVELNTISKTIRSAMSEGAGSFKEAASNSNYMLSKIAKDLSSVFNTQKKDTINLSTTMDEVLHESEQTSMKMDRLHSVFQETVSLQTNMLGELRNLSGNVKILNDSLYDLNKNVSSGNQSLLGGIGEVATNIAGLTLGAGAVIGGAHMLGGGGGETGGVQSEGAGGKYSAAQAASLIRKVGGTEKEAQVLGAISQPESAGVPTRVNNNPNTGDLSYGLWQINMLGKMGPERRAKYGLRSNEDLKNPETNARVALQILREKHGVPSDWSTWKSGKHLKYMEAAGRGASGGMTPPDATSVTSSSTPGSLTPQSGVTPSTGTTEMSGHSHPGIISGAMGGTEGVSSGALPHSDIVALGRSLQKMGLRISEHPDFGGVQGKHVKGSAHYDGRAIDINVGNNMVEANDPVWGKKFDQLADQLSASGYKVLWRTSGKYGYPGHDNHLHVQVGRGSSGHENEATPMASTTQGMAAMNAATQPQPEMSTASAAASPVQQTPIAPMVSGVPIGPQGMNPMMMGAMGGMSGGMGGMVGTLAPLLISAMASGMGQQLQGQTPPPAEMMQPVTGQKMNNQIISETAVQKEAQSEAATQETAINPPDTRANPNTIVSGNEGFNYNSPDDIGWPTWVSMLGGNHYNELKNGVAFNLFGQ